MNIDLNNLEEILILDKDPSFYRDVYDELIKQVKIKRPTLIKLEYPEYTEKHHILPRCMGGKDEDSNYILLSYREHVIAHCLLWLEDQDNSSLALAVIAMLYLTKGRKRQEYDSLEKLFSAVNDIKLKAIYKQSKPVVCLDFYTKELLEIFPSITSTSERNFSPSCITNAVSGNYTAAGGYSWASLEEYEKEHSAEVEEYFDKINSGYKPNIWKRSDGMTRYLSKEIVGFTEDLSIIKTYRRLIDTKVDGFNPDAIGSAAGNGENYSHGGYLWKFKKDFELDHPEYKDVNTDKIKYIDLFSIICHDCNYNIIKIYPTLARVEDDNFCSASVNKYIKLGSPYLGYYWSKMSTWKYEEKLNDYYNNKNKVNPVAVGKKISSRSVVKFNLLNNVPTDMTIYKTQREAEKLDGFNHSNITNAIKSNRKYKDYFWLPYDDFKQKYPKELKEYEERNKHNDNT